MKTIYFDHNATYPVHRNVIELMSEVMKEPINSSSIHSLGRKGKALIEQARERIQSLLNAHYNEYKVVFTSSGTEANNLALKGLPLCEVMTTTIDHPSVLNVVGEGAIPVDSNGLVILNELENALKLSNKTILVSIILANNETGVIQPIKELAKLIHQYGALIHTDATQATGKIPLDIVDLGVDMITITGHKFGGPIGAAALIFRNDIDLKPMIVGGGQEYRLRAGTPNVAAIAGFGLAAEIAKDYNWKDIEGLRNYIEDSIVRENSKSIVFSKNTNRLPNTSSFTMPGVKNITQVIHFDMNGIAVSAGSACSSGRADLPYVQMGMGYSKDVAETAIRVSLGLDSTKSEAEKFISTWKTLSNKKS